MQKSMMEEDIIAKIAEGYDFDTTWQLDAMDYLKTKNNLRKRESRSPPRPLHSSSDSRSSTGSPLLNKSPLSNRSLLSNSYPLPESLMSIKFISPIQIKILEKSNIKKQIYYIFLSLYFIVVCLFVYYYM